MTYLVMPPETLLAGRKVRHRVNILVIQLNNLCKVVLLMQSTASKGRRPGEAKCGIHDRTRAMRGLRHHLS